MPRKCAYESNCLHLGPFSTLFCTTVVYNLFPLLSPHDNQQRDSKRHLGNLAIPLVKHERTQESAHSNLEKTFISTAYPPFLFSFFIIKTMLFYIPIQFHCLPFLPLPAPSLCPNHQVLLREAVRVRPPTTSC